MSDNTEQKRGRGRPKGSGNKINVPRFKDEFGDISDVMTLIKGGFHSSIQELIKISRGMDEYKDASCTNRLGAHKELIALGLRFLSAEVEKSLVDGAAQEKAEEEAKLAEQSEKDTKKDFVNKEAINIFSLKRHT